MSDRTFHNGSLNRILYCEWVSWGDDVYKKKLFSLRLVQPVLKFQSDMKLKSTKIEGNKEVKWDKKLVSWNRRQKNRFKGWGTKKFIL